MKEASIVIPTRDKLSRLHLVLKALEGQINDAVEVVIVFDGCSDEVVKRFNDIKLPYKTITVIHDSNVGRARARNSGILRACGEIVIFLDDDRIPCAGFVTKHINRHKNGRYMVIGERAEIHYSEEKLLEICKTGFSRQVLEQMRKNSVKERYNVMKKAARAILGQAIERVTFTTGNSSVPRNELLKTGMFDENFSGWGVEDVDLGYRLSRNGLRAVRDYSIVNYHLLHPVDTGKQKIEYWRNFSYFMKKIEDDRMSRFIMKALSIFMYG
ncbi:GT2 family glycosyltransferase [Anaerobacterium chartisolvens]|uniref:GT2 family glycosyltransferase n=1 Tax=Anaerobacterium chartisolvens TaxID=1297424 RepID=A0A369BK33_9FIRM|nr:glycosyltransferase [Anaerobacterium chartisolvens]RCX20054.1 GT2 family glycosyltransferase [Anaerobacterium chartisolvens]